MKVATQVMSMLMSEKPLPWENLQPADRKRLGEFRKPVLELLNRNPDQRPTMSQFYDNCNAIFFSNTTTKIGDALSVPPEAAAPLPNTASDVGPNYSTGDSGTARGTGAASATGAASSTAEGAHVATASSGANTVGGTSGGKNSRTSTSKNASSYAEAEAEEGTTATMEDAQAPPDTGTEQGTLPLESGLKIV